MPALQQFFDAERIRRGWTMRETARRSRISLSKAYAISNGDDNVEFETFENIATAFSMSAAELAVAIGKGPETADPKRAPIHAVLREVPDEQLGTVESMLRGLAIQPEPPAKTRAVGPANSPRRRRGEIEADLDLTTNQGSKRRQLPIRALLEVAQHTLQNALPALTLNRDSGPLAATA